MTKEEKLISGLRRRSHTSLEKAIELYTPYVTVVVYGVIGAVMAREDIEEVVSEIFSDTTITRKKQPILPK